MREHYGLAAAVVTSGWMCARQPTDPTDDASPRTQRLCPEFADPWRTVDRSGEPRTERSGRFAATSEFTATTGGKASHDCCRCGPGRPPESRPVRRSCVRLVDGDLRRRTRPMGRGPADVLPRRLDRRPRRARSRTALRRAGRALDVHNAAWARRNDRSCLTHASPHRHGRCALSRRLGVDRRAARRRRDRLAHPPDPRRPPRRPGCADRGAASIGHVVG